MKYEFWRKIPSDTVLLGPVKPTNQTKEIPPSVFKENVTSTNIAFDVLLVEKKTQNKTKLCLEFNPAAFLLYATSLEIWSGFAQGKNLDASIVWFISTWAYIQWKCTWRKTTNSSITYSTTTCLSVFLFLMQKSKWTLHMWLEAWKLDKEKNLLLDKSLFCFLISLNFPSISFISQTKQHLRLLPILSALKMVWFFIT